MINGPLASVIALEVSRHTNPIVAYLGPEGSFTWEAAAALFPHAQLTSYKSITDVFREVERGAVDYGVVPFINSLEGPVGETVDALATHDVKIVSMGEMRITLCLAKKGTPRVVYTHPHAASQARKILQILEAEVVYTSSTSQAVLEFEKCENCGVIASPRALEKFSKTCGVEDRESYTRFAILSKEAPGAGESLNNFRSAERSRRVIQSAGASGYERYKHDVDILTPHEAVALGLLLPSGGRIRRRIRRGFERDESIHNYVEDSGEVQHYTN